MKDVGIRGLKAHASEIVRQVAENRESYTVTRRGRPVGVLSPAGREPSPIAGGGTQAWDRLEALADRMGGSRRRRRPVLRELAEIRC